MSGGRSPFTGFGERANSAIKFRIVRGRDGEVPDWEGGPRLVYLAIQNSNRTIRQNCGRDPWTVRFRLWFATVTDLEALDAMQGERATLRYPWGLTSRAGGAHERIVDVDYLRLDDTKLVEIGERSRMIGGGAEAMVTFERDYVDAVRRVPGAYPPAPDPRG